MTMRRPPREKVDRRHQLWKKLFLLQLSIVLSLVAGEILIRIVKPGFPGFRTPQIEHRVEAGIGFEMIPNQKGYTVAEPVTVNSIGFRGPEVAEKTAGNHFRILCLGDSMTYGVRVSPNDPYPRQLESILRSSHGDEHCDVINAGIQRYNTHQEIDLLKRMAPLLKPDVVVLGMYPNDFIIRPKGEFGIETENQREKAASEFRMRFPWAYLAVKNSALVEFTKLVLLNGSAEEYYMRLLRGEIDGEVVNRWNAMTAELESFRDLSLQYDFSPIVLTIPARIQVQQSFPNSQYPKRIHEICDRVELRRVDVSERFVDSLQNGSDPYLQWDDHLSTVGHTAVAVALADNIELMMSESERDGR